MPLFDYKCGACDHSTEIMVAKYDDVVPCPECQHPKMDKLMSRPSFKFANGRGTHMGSLMSIPDHPIKD